MAQIKIQDSVSTQPRQELLHVADVVARDKGIERNEVLAAMEEAIRKAAKAKYGSEHDIHAIIHKGNGSVCIEKHITVVEDDALENNVTQIAFSKLKEDKNLASYSVGDVLVYPLPPIDFGRVAVQSARQVIAQKVLEAERTKLYEEYAERIGQIISAIVKRVEFGNVILDLGCGEAMLRRNETIQREVFQVGERVRVLITEINPAAKGPMIFVSRTHPGFMAKLFEQEVPEIYDGVIEIKGIARDPGSRAKMAVYSNDPSLDPVGACVGMRGSRVQAIVTELQGEKVDIIPWSSDMATFVVNALAPAEALKVVIDEDAHRIDIVVQEDQLSLAIGRRGQNVRLASQLTEWKIDIITEEQELARRNEEYSTKANLFMESLDVDEMIAQLLVTEGFTEILEVADIPLEEFADIEGFDEEIAKELQRRARSFLENQEKKAVEVAKKSGVHDDLLSLDGLPYDTLEALVNRGIKTRDDFADLSADELLEIIGTDAMTDEDANALIMRAREHWFTEQE